MKSLHNVSTARITRDAALERLWALAILLSQGMQAGLAERGLSLARAQVIWQLRLNGPITQRSLSRALRVTPRNVTGLVDGLEADGLVARRRHPSDRRATLVSMTPRGAAIAAAMRKDQDGFAQRLFKNLTEDDVATLVRVLDQILDRVRELLPLQP